MKCISALKSIFRVPTALVWPLRTRVIPAQAAANGHTECVRLLLENGADPDKQDEEGTTPLMIAIESHNDKIALELGKLLTSYE